MNNNQNYYSVIPSFIIADANLTPNAKLLYAVISSLCNQNAVCWATNAYFAEIFKTDERTIQRWILELAKKKLIDVGVNKNKNGTSREITLNLQARQKCHTGTTKMSYGHDKNVTHNNIIDNSINPVNCINTSLLNKKSSKKKEKPKDFDEVLGYFQDKCTELFTKDYTNTIATDFYEFYESKGWLVGKSPMKNWHMAANRWIRVSINDEKGAAIERYGKGKNVAYKQKETAKTPITDEEWDEILYGKGEK